jgi:hypothetical protein
VNVLIIGAGAVGQVYAQALERGGATIAFLVKPRHAKEARAGFAMYPLNAADRWTPRRFEGFAVYTAPDQLTGTRWDLVLLAVSGPALRGEWLAPTLAAAPDAAIVLLTAGMAGTHEQVLAAAPGREVVLGMIPFMSYHAPISDEPIPTPGTAWWLPPLASCGFDGGPVVDELVRTLRAGGLRAGRSDQVVAAGAFGGAFLGTHMAALEVAGWSFDTFTRTDALRLAADAGAEALAITAAERDLPLPFAFRLLRPALTRHIPTLARWLAPHDVEAFFRVHFTKVGDQTREQLVHTRDEGRARGLPTTSLQALLDRLGVQG